MSRVHLVLRSWARIFCQRGACAVTTWPSSSLPAPDARSQALLGDASSSCGPLPGPRSYGDGRRQSSRANRPGREARSTISARRRGPGCVRTRPGSSGSGLEATTAPGASAAWAGCEWAYFAAANVVNAAVRSRSRRTSCRCAARPAHGRMMVRADSAPCCPNGGRLAREHDGLVAEIGVGSLRLSPISWPARLGVA